jgi:hypothetical protein
MDIAFAIFGASERKSSMDMTRKTLEDPRTIISTRPGTKPTRFQSSMNYYFPESYLEVGKGKSPITIRHLEQTDRKVALEGRRRLQKTPEQRRSPKADKWGRPAPHVRPASLVPPGSDLSFLRRLPTDLYDASQPLFQVDLIQGLWFTPPGYISRSSLPPQASPSPSSLATSRTKARVSPSIQLEVEIPLDDRLVLVLLVVN